MKVSIQTVNFYNELYNCSKPITDVDDIVNRIGVQLGAVEEVEHWGRYYDGIVVARVISCDKHPNADKLHVCLIDDGGTVKNVVRNNDGYIEVVCGAPNVKTGLTVAWLPPGSTVPSTANKDPFVLEARELRGVVSNGMLASPAELNISSNHDGILEINEDEVGAELIKPGTPFCKLYGLDDVVIDCENKMFTHRPDCFGILGVARELAGIRGLEFKSPDWYTKGSDISTSSDLPLKVKVKDKNLVPRFMAISMRNIDVKPSPIWLQSFLTRVGIKPINNIVDLTNYYMQLTGQPLHAYDYDKVAKLSGAVPTLVARQAKKGEKITLLNGKTVEFDAPTVVIATDKQAIGVGGIMGGSETEVDESTKNIILECANFDMYNIRRTSMKYGLFTDAVTRFTKGQSIYQNDRVLKKIVTDITKDYDGGVASELIDIKIELPKQHKVTLTRGFVNDRLGSDLSVEHMKQLLENVECIVNVKGEELEVDPPFWRTDIEIAEDVVEEIGRLYGYNKLPVALPKRNVAPAKENTVLKMKTKLRELLSGSGANEVLTYSFVHGNLIKRVDQDKSAALELSNALSPDLQYYRMSLLPSLLDKVHANIKAGHDEIALFEINKVHCKDFIGDDELPVEDQRLAFVFAADTKRSDTSYYGAAYYQAKEYLEYLLASLGIEAYFEPVSSHHPKLSIGKAAIAPFEPKRAAYVKSNSGGELIGEIGEFKPSLRKNLKLPNFIAGFELDIERLLTLSQDKKYIPLSRFPSTEQDITLQVGTNISYGTLVQEIQVPIDEASKQRGYAVEIRPLDIYQEEDSAAKNITLRLKITHQGRTLVTEEVNHLLKSIAEHVSNTISATKV